MKLSVTHASFPRMGIPVGVTCNLSVPVHLLAKFYFLSCGSIFCPVNVTNQHFLGIMQILFILSTVFSGTRFASDPVSSLKHTFTVDGKVFVPHAGTSETLASYGA